jgi:hypothetical protein
VQYNYKFKTNYKYEITNPIKQYHSETPIEKMELITVILRFCTLLDDIPHGVALIEYRNLEIKELSF